MTTNSKPWETAEFIDFMNDMNELATKKYGWNVAGHSFETNEFLTLILIPALGADSMNRKFQEVRQLQYIDQLKEEYSG